MPVSLLLTATGCGGGDFPEGERIGSVQQQLGSAEPLTWIYNLSQLRNMTVSGNYRLANDIDASATAWAHFQPIGSPFEPFHGTFDGDGHTINNLHIDDSSWYSGMFRALQGAIVKDVGLTNVDVKGSYYTGALAAMMSDSELSNSYVTGTVSSPDGAAGMVIGHAGTHARITRCYSTGTITGGAQRVGGFIGEISAWGEVTAFDEPRASVTEIYTEVNVTPNTSSGTVYAGGLVGYATGARIYDINIAGSVIGRNYVGGAIGFVDNEKLNQPRSTVEDVLVHKGYITNAAQPNRSGIIGGANGLFMRCEYNYWDTWADGGTAPPLAPGQSEGCQVGKTSNELKAPYRNSVYDVLLSPFHKGQLITQQMIDSGARDQCALGSGSDGDAGFNTCGNPDEDMWELNGPQRFNSLKYIPNPSIQSTYQ